MNTPTPRTDAAITEEDTGYNGLINVVSPEFARTLERELAAEKEAGHKGEHRCTPEHSWKQWSDELYAENQALRARAEADLREMTEHYKWALADALKFKQLAEQETARAEAAESLNAQISKSAGALLNECDGAAFADMGCAKAELVFDTALALRETLAQTPASMVSKLAELEKERDAAIHERKCCHEIYDNIRRALGYPDGVGYPMLADEVRKVVARLAELDAELARLREENASLIRDNERHAVKWTGERDALRARVAELEKQLDATKSGAMYFGQQAADAASVERMRERVTNILIEKEDAQSLEDVARAVLASLGITSAKGRKKR
jgi:hypothetical protein